MKDLQTFSQGEKLTRRSLGYVGSLAPFNKALNPPPPNIRDVQLKLGNSKKDNLRGKKI